MSLIGEYENILNRDMMYFASFFNSILTNNIVKIRLGFILFCCYYSRTLLSTSFLLPDLVYGFIKNGIGGKEKRPNIETWNNFRKIMSGRGYSIKTLGALWKIQKMGINVDKLGVTNKNSECGLCMDVCDTYFVNLGCKHELCLSCFVSFMEKCETHDCCPFCRRAIFSR